MVRLLILIGFLTISAVSRGIEFQVTSYDLSHRKIVESGFQNFTTHFYKSDDKEKSSLLFCLERYVDPYFKASINYESKLYAWLFELLNSNESIVVKEHALGVLNWDDSRNMYDCEISEKGELVCESEDQSDITI